MDKLQSSPVVQRIVALIPYRHNRSTQRRVCGAWAAAFLMLSVMFLFIAAVAPAWSITRFDGDGTIGPLSYSVDVIIGDGLWKKNQCWGDYNEELLRNVGLSCDGTPQLTGCDHVEKLTQDQVDNCELMELAESMQLFAVFCATQAFLAMMISTCVTRRQPAFLIASICAFLASYSASSVTAALRDSYMFKATGTNYECMQVLAGIGEVCHGVGPAFGLQSMAIFFTCAASLIALMLACSKQDEEDVSMIRAPLVVMSESDEQVPDAEVAQAVRIF